MRNFVARAADHPAGSEITKVTVFDLENKLVAYSGTFGEGVREVVSQWGKIYVLENDGKVCLVRFSRRRRLTFMVGVLSRGDTYFCQARDALPEIVVRPRIKHGEVTTTG